MKQSLAVKYRPKTFNDVVEQDTVKQILQYQLNTGTFVNAYLLTGPAGCAKTTLARIFANEINDGKGTPIELDAASQNSVDDVRQIIDEAYTRSIMGEYKVYIIDECHSLSNNAWQAMLKLIEEPPKYTIFIFCTTDPQKIPATIISRVQQYRIQKITPEGISKRLAHILKAEDNLGGEVKALDYIAKIANGGMRDAITLLDKCISFGDITLTNVMSVVGESDFETMFNIINAMIFQNPETIIQEIDKANKAGTDMKLMAKQLFELSIDLNLYNITKVVEATSIPLEYSAQLAGQSPEYWEVMVDVMSALRAIVNEIKWTVDSKMYLLGTLLQFSLGK